MEFRIVFETEYSNGKQYETIWFDTAKFTVKEAIDQMNFYNNKGETPFFKNWYAEYKHC